MRLVDDEEVVEALRWARRLISSGTAIPSEIAIASASTAPWDDHVFALAADAGLRVHFVHGVPRQLDVTDERISLTFRRLLRAPG